MSDVESVARRAKLGVVFSTAGRLGVTAVILARTVVLLRLLEPRDFGVVQLCFMIVDLATTVGDFGFSAAQIQQHDEVRREQTNALFVVDLGLKIILFGLMLALLPTVAAYFNEPLLQAVLPALAAYMLVDAFSVPGLTLLTRRLRFDLTASIEFAAQCVEAVTSIVLAVAGFGIWSLVFGRLAGSALSGALACWLGRWWPSLSIDMMGSASLLRFGGWLFVRNLFKYLSENVDFFFVGRFLGAHQLGYYSKAFEVMRLPQSRLSRAIAVVVFPAFSRIQNQPEKVASGLRKVVLAVSLIASPALIGLALVARELVVVLFGERWVPMVPALQVMCFAGVIHAVDPFLVSVFTAVGAVRVAALRRAVEFVLLGIGSIVGIRWGIVGVAVALVIVAAVATVGTAAMGRLIRVSGWRDYLRPQLPAALGSAVMAGVVMATRWALARFVSLPDWAMLLSLSTIGAVAYVAAIIVVRSADVVELWHEVAGDVGRVGAVVKRKLGLGAGSDPREQKN